MRSIDVDMFLRDIEIDAPSGSQDLETDPAFIALEELAKGVPEVWVGDKKVKESQPPPWKDVKASAFELLERTHDIRVTIVLLRALLHTDGLPGLADGLLLLSGMVEKHWDSLYPQLDPLDDNDPTQRVNILMDLCDRKLMLTPLMLAPLCSSRAVGTFTLRDIHIAIGKISLPEEEKARAASTSIIQAAFQDCGPDRLLQTASAVAEALECLSGIETFLTERIGSSDAPSFAEVRQVFEDMATALAKYQGLADAASEKSQEPAAQSTENSAAEKKQGVQLVQRSMGKSMEEITTRQDVITLLDSICSYYEKYEPASPLPLLLKRARGLVDKDFLTIMQELAPDAVSQIKLLGGIKDEQSY